MAPTPCQPLVDTGLAASYALFSVNAPQNHIDTRVLDFIAAPEGKDFGSLALDVFAYQFEQNLPYQRFCLARDKTPETVQTWQAIPAVPTVAFKELDLTCGPPEKVFLTSGTTQGQEKRGRHLVPDLQLYHASALAHFLAMRAARKASAAGPEPDSRTPRPNRTPSLTQMAEWVMRELGTPGSRYFIDADGIQSGRLCRGRRPRPGERVSRCASWRLPRPWLPFSTGAPSIGKPLRSLPAAALWIRAAIRAKAVRSRATAICSRAGNTSRSPAITV